MDNFKNIVYDSLEQFVPHKKIRKNSDPDYYNKEIKRLKSKVRKVYSKRKLGEPYTERLKHLSKQLLAAKKSAQEAFLKQFYGKRETVGRTSTNMLGDVKKIGKIFHPSRTVTDGLLQMLRIKQIRLIHITHQFSVARELLFTLRVEILASHS